MAKKAMVCLLVALWLSIVQVDCRGVAFCAFGSGTPTLLENQRIPFPGVRFNLGNAYDARHSIFNCPDNGLYMIYTTLLSKDSSMWYHIVQDNRGLAYGYTGHPNQASSQVAMVKCRRNRHIWVRRTAVGGGARQIWGGHSQFCGVKITDAA